MEPREGQRLITALEEYVENCRSDCQQRSTATVPGIKGKGRAKNIFKQLCTFLDPSLVDPGGLRCGVMNRAGSLTYRRGQSALQHSRPRSKSGSAGNGHPQTKTIPVRASHTNSEFTTYLPCRPFPTLVTGYSYLAATHQ